MSINLKNKQEIVKAYGKNEKDTGSAAVQIAMMTKKISELTEHLKSNKKDFATKRGLLMIGVSIFVCNHLISGIDVAVTEKIKFFNFAFNFKLLSYFFKCFHF